MACKVCAYAEMSNFNNQANSLIVAGHYAEAQSLLESELQRTPAGWKPQKEDDQFLQIAFWDQEEFLAYSHHHRDRLTKSIIWANASYSNAWYQLALVAVEEEQFDHALFCLDCGLQLEPDHPELWSEKGYVLGRLKRHQEAFECYVRAASVRDWTPASQMARSLRGQGTQLIDLNRLDDGEVALQKSLELEPDNEIAQNELKYIESLRSKQAH
jgi:tetratricopeptide (TPR) repeat protein